jgi:hypothetical protein
VIVLFNAECQAWDLMVKNLRRDLKKRIFEKGAVKRLYPRIFGPEAVFCPESSFFD